VREDYATLRQFLLICAAAGSLWAADATPKPVLKVRIELAQVMKEPPGVPSSKRHAIDSLTFSNDGKRLALLATGHVQTSEGLVHVVVIDWDKPKPSAVTLGSAIENRAAWSLTRTLRWSSDDSLLLIDQEKPVLLDAETGMPRCGSDPNEKRTALTAGFAGADRFYVVYRIAPSGTMFTLRDFDCHVVGEHRVNDRVIGISAYTSDRIALHHEGGFLILGAPDWKESKRIADDRISATPVFLNHGHTLCAADVSSASNVSVLCWAIGDAAITQLRKYDAPTNSTLPISGAAKASRVAFLEGMINGSLQWVRFGQYVVWDPESGTTLATLPAQTQHFEVGRSRAEAPFMLALSPDGSLLALAGENVVEVYSLPGVAK